MNIIIFVIMNAQLVVILFGEGNECDKTIKECYDKTLKGYFFDINNNTFKKCFVTCNSCYGPGNTFNNCKECKHNFIFLNESNYKTICFEACNNFYYFKEGNEY